LAVLLVLATYAPIRLLAAIQYAGGTNINTTFTGDTRTTIADGIKTAIAAAGWTTVSGVSGNWIMQSALTPQNLQARVNLLDPGSGNCTQVIFRNVSGTKIGNPLWLLPAALKTFRVIANRYQFFVLVPGSVVARDFVAGGVPALPAFLNTIITEAFWSEANSISDTDASGHTSFRNRLGHGATPAMNSLLCNGNLWSGNTQHIGNLGLIAQGSSYTNYPSGYVWHNGNYLLYDALIGWGLTLQTDPMQIRGYMYDAAVTSAVLAVDSTTTFDGHNWHSMQGYVGNGDDTQAGTLLVVVP